PEFQAFALGAIAANVAKLMSHAVDHADKNSVRDGMSALNGAPGVMLREPEFGLLIRVPANGRRIKKDVGALQRGEARALGIPLIPTDQSAHAAIIGVEGFEA